MVKFLSIESKIYVENVFYIFFFLIQIGKLSSNYKILN